MSNLKMAARALLAWPRLARAAKAPEVAQAAVWAQTAGLIERAPFWRDRMGPKLPPLAELDVTTYDDYRPAIERSFQGTVSELNGEHILHWVLSSGSSGPQKMFPWTKTFAQQFRAGIQMPLNVMVDILRLRGGVGAHLALIAQNPKRRSPTGIPVGYASNLAEPALNPRQDHVYPAAVDDDQETFRIWMPLYAMACPLQSISAVTADHILMVFHRIENDFAFYLPYLRGDERPPWGMWAPKVSPARLAHLQAVASASEPLTLKRVWPTLRLIQTWRSSTAGLQARKLETRLGPGVTIIDAGYASSEGPIANQIDCRKLGGPIHPGGILHEFLEPGAPGDKRRVLKAWELKEGEEYELLLTSAMGLVRYRIGDVVRCTGFYHRAPTISFVRRATRELSLGVTTFGEDELVALLESLDRPLDGQRVFGPSDDALGLVLYTDTTIPPALIERMHTRLFEVNGTYRDFLSQGRVRRLSATVLPPSHPLWEHCRPKHGQAKPVILLQNPPSTLTADAG